MAAYVKYEIFTEDLAKKIHNLHTDSLKVMLSNSAPNVSTHQIRSSVTELSTANGYTSGGSSITNSVSRSGGTSSILATDVVFTASGGSIGPFRYVILYNDTPASPVDPLIAYWDYGSSITLADTETFTVDFTTTAFTLA